MNADNGVLIHHVLGLVILILGLGMFSGRLAGALKLPDVALFLFAGMIVGKGLHLINEPSSTFVNQFILLTGSALILFDGGKNIALGGLKKVWLTLTLLSVPGVLLTCGVTAVAARFLLDLPWLYAVLLGAVIASTDPATLIPVFRQVKVRTKVRETVESESAFNDATGSILTFTVLAMVTGGGGFSLTGAVKEFAVTAFGGIAVGLAVGYVLLYLVAHSRLGLLRDYTTIAMMVTAISAYLAGDLLHVSGFMATFVAGLVWGNAGSFGLNVESKEREMAHFSDNVTVIMRMLIFILLGSQVNFTVILANMVPSLAVLLVFMLVARPLTVLACALPDRKAKWERNEILFMFWVRETGVIPAALSGMIAAQGVAHADVISSVTFLAVLLTILVQASTTGWLARRLGLALPDGR
ncbi:transporter monovalent cation:proton antiporter-2 family protein [Paenibacillus sp. J31TS4]|uniref:cation:proton antiporter n=1 Tax=Paenibacillus sp. J31TS4 TaxID=2807195 RepID=UPI001B116585|nr:sodium:proton antiporter [Paenibacillus sp. J31TS4]GIP40707.1 transporter monovalent cation:proton antiporter-2 family protein [Paenibacillus sp. J31TS4]